MNKENDTNKEGVFLEKRCYFVNEEIKGLIKHRPLAKDKIMFISLYQEKFYTIKLPAIEKITNLISEFSLKPKTNIKTETITDKIQTLTINLSEYYNQNPKSKKSKGIFDLEELNFEFKILQNKNLLPSFHYKDQNNEISIKHYLDVIVCDDIFYKNQFNFFSEPIIIKNISRITNDKPYIVFKEIKLHKLFVIPNKGKFAVAISLPKNSYAYTNNTTKVIMPKDWPHHIFNERMRLKINIDGSEMDKILVDKIFIVFRRKILMCDRGFLVNNNIFEKTKLIYDRNYDVNSQKSQNHILINEEITYPKEDFLSKATEIYQEYDENINSIKNKYLDYKDMILPPLNDNLFQCIYNIKVTIKFYNISTLDQNIDFDVDLFSNYHFNKDNEIYIDENDIKSYDYFSYKENNNNNIEKNKIDENQIKSTQNDSGKKSKKSKEKLKNSKNKKEKNNKIQEEIDNNQKNLLLKSETVSEKEVDKDMADKMGFTLLDDEDFFKSFMDKSNKENKND